MKKRRSSLLLFILMFSLIFPVSSYSYYDNNNNNNEYNKIIRNIPCYDGKPSQIVNNNEPFFDKPKNKKVYKKYSDLDNLNRVGTCEVVTGKEYIPTVKRENINKVKPTGWKQKKYHFIKGKYLYNRCHLIAYKIAGDNDDKRNLMTGTRYMNVAMIPYENKIVKYIKETNNHVKYRVSPIFLKNEMVATGVLLEAYSIEDNKIRFNVFCYNVQPSILINYKNGDSIRVDPFVEIKMFTIDLFKERDING